MISKEDENNEEVRELRDQLDFYTRENEKLGQDLDLAKVGYSNVVIAQNMNETKELTNRLEELEREKADSHKKYLELLEKTTEIEQKFREEELKRKQQEHEIEDLQERLKFYTQGQNGGNLLLNEPITISNINQSDFSSLMNTNYSENHNIRIENDISIHNLMVQVDNITEAIMPFLRTDTRSTGKEKLLGLKEMLLQRLKTNSEDMKSLKDINKQLRQENDDLIDISEENKIRIEGLEEDLMTKLIADNKRLRKLMDDLEGKANESAKLAKNLITKVVKRDFENQRLWKIKKRLTKEMVNNEMELYDQMNLLHSTLVGNLLN